MASGGTCGAWGFSWVEGTDQESNREIVDPGRRPSARACRAPLLKKAVIDKDGRPPHILEPQCRLRFSRAGLVAEPGAHGFDRRGVASSFLPVDLGCSVTPSRAAASARKRRSSSSCDLVFSIHWTAWVHHFFA